MAAILRIGRTVLAGLALALSGCIHQAPTVVDYDPVDRASRTDLVGLATRDFGFERGELPPLDAPVHLAFSWLRDTRAFPHRYGTDGWRTVESERRVGIEVLATRLSAPPFAPVSRIPSPSAYQSVAPMATPVVPLSSAARRAVLSGRRLGAEVLVVFQTRSEARLVRNVLAPFEAADPSRRLLPVRDLAVDVQAEACAIWARKGWLLHCSEADARETARWVPPLLREETFARLRQQALRASLERAADAILDALIPLVEPPAPSPEEVAAPPAPASEPAAPPAVSAARPPAAP